MLGFILRFLPSFAPAIAPLLNPWVLLAFVLIVSGAFASGGFFGFKAGISELHEYKGKQATEAVRIITKRGEVTEKVVTKWRTVDRIIEKQGETIIKEVPIYVTAQDDAACRVPAGFIRLWNDANTGNIPEPSGAVRQPAGGRDGGPATR